MTETSTTQPPTHSTSSARPDAGDHVRHPSQFYLVRHTKNAFDCAQKAQAAESFGAEGEFLSACKKLLDTKHPRFKAVTSVRNRARAYWTSLSLPYPEPGIRLVRQDALETFQDQMSVFKDELEEAVAGLDERYSALRSRGSGAAG